MNTILDDRNFLNTVDYVTNKINVERFNILNQDTTLGKHSPFIMVIYPRISMSSLELTHSAHSHHVDSLLQKALSKQDFTNNNIIKTAFLDFLVSAIAMYGNYPPGKLPVDGLQFHSIGSAILHINQEFKKVFHDISKPGYDYLSRCKRFSYEIGKSFITINKCLESNSISFPYEDIFKATNLYLRES